MTTRAAPVIPDLSYTHPEVERHLEQAAKHRHYAEKLIAAIEEQIHEYAGLSVVPLDLAERASRAVVKLHTANLLHVGSVPDELLRDAS